MWPSLRPGLEKMNLDSPFSYIIPVLIVLGIGSIIADKIHPLLRWPKIYRWLFVVVLAVLTIIPLDGISIATLLLSFNPNYSLGLAIVLVVILARRLWGVSLLSSRDLWYLSIWSVGLGIVLYAGSLGFLPYDIYPLGYDSSLFFFIIGGLTIAMVLVESRLQWVFISYITAFNLGLLPSPNFLDYIIDPFLFLFCSAIISSRIVKSVLKGFSEGV